MKNLRAQLRKNKLLKFLASVKLTVVCLVLLFILTFWGTIAQGQHGLYLAQERYFHAFFFLIFGFIPFPGAQAVLWVLFLNLVGAAVVRLVYKWRNAGVIIIHFGILLFFVSAYVTLHAAQESYLTLGEGQAANVSTAYYDWELSVWESAPPDAPLKILRQVTAFDAQHFRAQRTFELPSLGLHLSVLEYHQNANAYSGGTEPSAFLNASGIRLLQPADLDTAPEKNIPGGIFEAVANDGSRFKILLYGGDPQPTSFKGGAKTYSMILRLKRYPLPFTLKLVDFMMEQHPGTNTARSFKSRVAIEINKAWREKLISMNNPLRYRDYTLYQSSYAIDKAGNESSTLAVVKNAGRLLPYIATCVTFSGLVIHFFVMAFIAKTGTVESPYVDNGHMNNG